MSALGVAGSGFTAGMIAALTRPATTNCRRRVVANGSHTKCRIICMNLTCAACGRVGGSFPRAALWVLERRRAGSTTRPPATVLDPSGIGLRSIWLHPVPRCACRTGHQGHQPALPPSDPRALAGSSRRTPRSAAEHPSATCRSGGMNPPGALMAGPALHGAAGRRTGRVPQSGSFQAPESPILTECLTHCCESRLAHPHRSSNCANSTHEAAADRRPWARRQPTDRAGIPSKSPNPTERLTFGRKLEAGWGSGAPVG